MKTTFGAGQWNRDSFVHCFSHRFTETPDFVQEAASIGSGVNPEHREGIDNISLLTKETFSAGTRAEIVCSFEGLGCPEIIIVPETENCDDGAVRYGACFEVVLWKNGFNVWRHYRDEGRCHWHRRLGLTFPVAEHEKHTLTVTYQEKYMVITVDGFTTTLRTDDLPEKYHVGITVCEGIARIHSLSVEPADGSYDKENGWDE